MRNNTQFPFLCFPRIPLHTNDVPTTQLVVNTKILFLGFVEPVITKPMSAVLFTIQYSKLSKSLSKPNPLKKRILLAGKPTTTS